MKNIKIENYKGKVTKSISRPFFYYPSLYGISNEYTGKDVKICIIDSGCPDHKDISVKGEKVTFCDNDRDFYDRIGHSTIISGIIGANSKKSIVGFSPSSEFYFAKVIDRFGKCNFNSVVAAILWAIVKDVDVVLIALGTDYNYSVMHNVIHKAVDHGICIISASGNSIKKNELIVDFPSKYAEVFSVATSLKDVKKNKILGESVDFVLPSRVLQTTYLDNQYTKINGSSVCAAVVCGLTSLLIEKNKKDNINKKSFHKTIYSQLLHILNK